MHWALAVQCCLMLPHILQKGAGSAGVWHPAGLRIGALAAAAAAGARRRRRQAPRAWPAGNWPCLRPADRNASVLAARRFELEGAAWEG